VRATIGLSAGILVAIALYPLLRIGAGLWGHEANPATLLYSTHAGYFWRAWTCAYAGAMVAAIVALIAKPAHLRFAEPMLWISFGLLALQALFIP
jgi:hypothetical protein